jgi:hypothetical protein
LDATISAAGLPMRLPASLRETRPAPRPIVAESGRHRTSWADDAADFAAGIEDARFSVDPTAEGFPR